MTDPTDNSRATGKGHRPVCKDCGNTWPCPWAPAPHPQALVRTEALRALSEVAPPGPWTVAADDPEVVMASDDIEVTTAFALSGPQTRATAAFIAAMENYLRALLAAAPAPTALFLPGVEYQVTVTYDPDLPTLGRTDWHPTRIVLREPNPGVLLHEVLHVLVAHAPETPLPPGHVDHEKFVRFLTAGLGAYLDIPLPPHSPLLTMSPGVAPGAPPRDTAADAATAAELDTLLTDPTHEGNTEALVDRVVHQWINEGFIAGPRAHIDLEAAKDMARSVVDAAQGRQQ